MKQVFRYLPILLLVFALKAQAQLEPLNTPPVKGKFFVSVDDEATLFVNGTKLYHAPLNESESPELELKPGDRIVVKLKNVLGRGRFMILFMSTDRKQMISFTPRTFKILPDATAKDFSPADFADYKKQAKAVLGEFAKPYLLPFKSRSRWIWGQVDVSSIGCLVTPELFQPNNHP